MILFIHFPREWTEDDSKLNDKQREAIAAITVPQDIALPPVLIIGMLLVILESENDVLLPSSSCSYSLNNSQVLLVLEKRIH